MPPYPKPPKHKKQKKPDIPPEVRAALLRRSVGLCEGCELRAATDAHHRLYRSRGGLHLIENLLHLCGSGNSSGCHGIAHSGKEGEDLGWAIRSGGNALLVPVSYRGKMLRLTSDGNVKPVPTSELAAGFVR